MYSRIFALPLLAFSLAAQTAPPSKPVTLRSSLLEQLRTTHNRQEWFVPANAAVEGLTPKQASWTDGSGNHSVGQLANHLIFWNRQQLSRMRGEPTARPGNNDETFNAFDAAKWSATIRELDEVLTALEKEVEGMSDEKLQQFASAIGHIATHNAYHVGQMLFVRKLQGSWDPARGVK